MLDNPQIVDYYMLVFTLWTGMKGVLKMLYPSIEAERARIGKTKQELAEMLNISPKTLANWQSGRTSIPTTALIKMAKIFGCTTDYLLGLNDSQRSA